MFWDTLSERSKLTRADAAAVFGSALALRAEAADLVEFGWSTKEVPFTHGEAVLDVRERFHRLGGTHTTKALRDRYRDHDRVVIVTDEQAAPITPEDRPNRSRRRSPSTPGTWRATTPPTPPWAPTATPSAA